MTRKRKSDQEPSTETPTAVVENTAVTTEAPVLPATDAAEGGFAEQVGKKKWVPDPDPFGIQGQCCPCPPF